MYRKRLAENKSVSPDEFNGSQREKIQEVLASEEVLRSRRLTLYQYTTCPFCNKVKALLECSNLPYDIVEVDPLFKTEIKESGYGKVPQLRIGEDGPLMVDSDQIVDYLSPLLVSQGISEDERKKWTDWANNVLARYLVINTNRSLSESFQGYHYVEGVENFGTLRKYIVMIAGGLSMYLVSKLITKKRLAPYGYTADKDERTSLYSELNSWAESLSEQEQKTGKVYHGGQLPDRSDIEVYGILQSVRSFPVYRDITVNCNTNLGTWLQEMDKVAGKQSRE